MLVAFISGLASESEQDEVLLSSPLGTYRSGMPGEADRLFDELIVTRRLQRIGTRSGQTREWRILLPGLPAAIGRAV